jgi:transposase
MYFFERAVTGRRYRIAAQSVWDPATGRSVGRQVVLGPADCPPLAQLSETYTVGTRAVGDVGALAWVAEQLDLVTLIDRACGVGGERGGPTLGEMVVAVAIQRACDAGPKRDLAQFWDESIPRVSCLPCGTFTGNTFHRLAAQVDDVALERAQVAMARAAVARFDLATDVLAFDTTNFDTHIATTTPGKLAQRGHAKSKRADLRVVGLGLMVSETGHVPLLYRTYAGNGSDQSVLESCLDGLGKLHDALDEGEGRKQPAKRTLVRDGGFWSPQLELCLDVTGYYSIISLPLGHTAAEAALQHAAQQGAMKALGGDLQDVRAARMRTQVGELDRTLVIVESKELLVGQKRGVASALRKAKKELAKLEKRAAGGRITKTLLEQCVAKALAREHLAEFVMVCIDGEDARPSFSWRVDTRRRRELERTRLGKRVLCTDRHTWGNERIVHGFRGQWHVEELFRRTKKGGIVPWGPSYQWADASLRLHTFATVLGLLLVSLVRLELRTRKSVKLMMSELADIRATLVRTSTGKNGRRPTVLLAPEMTPFQKAAVRRFELARWLPILSSSMTDNAGSTGKSRAPTRILRIYIPPQKSA